MKGDDAITAAKAFSSLAIISLLTTPAESFLRSLPMVAMSTGCLDRIQAFLLSQPHEDQRSMSSSLSESRNGDPGLENAFEMHNLLTNRLGYPAVVVDRASIRPSPEAPVALHDIKFQTAKGSLTMIVGVVGSGKSTLLKAILGELKCENGGIRVSSKQMAYCSQTPWLQNATVRQIVCGPDESSEDPEWYYSTIHACAFDEDVLQLPDQHETMIGSRGVTLSGGQKQRLVSLPFSQWLLR